MEDNRVGNKKLLVAKGNKVSKLKIIYFHFLSYFYLSILNLELRISMMLHMTVTDCHISQLHSYILQKDIEDFRIILSYYILIVYSIHIL